MEPGKKQDLVVALIREIEELGHAMGLEFEGDLVEINMKILHGLEKDADTSMQRDVAAGKPSEIEGLVHQVVQLGDRYGLEMPAYRKISRWAREKGIR